MQAILSETGFAFNATEYANVYGNEQLLKLQRKYTIRTVDRTTKIPQVTKTFRIVKGPNCKIIEFPRFCMNELTSSTPSATAPIVRVTNQLPKHDRLCHINYVGQSNPNQLVVADYVEDAFAQRDVDGYTLRILAGLGKTFVAMDLIGRLQLKTLVVVPNTYLLDQWVGLLTQYFPEARIGTLYGKQKKDGDIIVSIINTAADLSSFIATTKQPGQRKKIQETVSVDDLFAGIGLTVFDESQMYVSKEFRKVFQRIRSRYTIGLSATPDIREDKLDAIHQSWIGPILDAESLEGYNVTTDAFISDARLIEYHAQDEHCRFNVRDDGMIDYASIVEALTTDPNRNALIVDQIIELMMSGLYTFVFSDRRSHLEHLYELLEARCNDLGLASSIELPEAEKKVILYGGAKEETIEKAKTMSTVVLTTYAYSAVGVSITKMNALVLSTPRRSNMTQIINRVFRLGSDQTIKRIIIDICDAKMPIKQQVRERIKAYNQRGSKILKSTHYSSAESGSASTSAT